MALTNEQQAVFDDLENFIKSQKNYFVIKGYAGTGKTFLVDYFAENYTKNYKLAITAPTHKALKVMRRNAIGKYSAEFRTIHSLLGLKEQIDAYGNQRFVQDYKDDASVNEYDIIIIDEASMVSDELLIGSKYNTGLFDYIELYETKVIFVGDPAQIPPIGKTFSLPFDSDWIKNYSVKVGELDKIVRQAEGNPIIETTMKIRSALKRDIVLPIRKDKTDSAGHGVRFLGAGNKKELLQLLETYFTSEDFTNDADYVKIIAWRNKTVKAFNKLVRGFLFDNSKKIQVGEKLIANTPIFHYDEMGLERILFNTNDEFMVVGYEYQSVMWQNVSLKVYHTTVLDEEGNTKYINILHEDSQDDYQVIIDYMVESAKAEKKGSYQAAQKWQDFYRFKKEFADVNYNYCITAHKSQGSTYENVFVLESDIDANRKVYERNRIKYTAFSRPSKRLFIVD